MRSKIDLYAGLLGVGKTTLIKRLLETEYAGKKVAIIENEIGKVNLDSAELGQASVTITEITGGCVCCTIQGEFTRAVDQLSEQLQPEYIIIEPTGAADITGLIEACQKTEKAEIRRLIMVTNAKKVATLLKIVGPFYTDQIRAASCIYFNFADHLTPEKLAQAREAVWNINPDAKIIETPLQEITADTFSGQPLGTGPTGGYFVENGFAMASSTDADSHSSAPIVDFRNRGRKSGLEIQSLDDTTPIDGKISGKIPGRNRSNSSGTKLYTWTLEIKAPLSESKLKDLMNALQNTDQCEIWRVKGILPMDTGENRKIDFSFGDWFEEEISPEAIPSDITGKLVLIGPRINRSYLRHIL